MFKYTSQYFSPFQTIKNKINDLTTEQIQEGLTHLRILCEKQNPQLKVEFPYKFSPHLIVPNDSITPADVLDRFFHQQFLNLHFYAIERIPPYVLPTQRPTIQKDVGGYSNSILR